MTHGRDNTKVVDQRPTRRAQRQHAGREEASME
jgi:hypothetical protein